MEKAAAPNKLLGTEERPMDPPRAEDRRLFSEAREPHAKETWTIGSPTPPRFSFASSNICTQLPGLGEQPVCKELASKVRTLYFCSQYTGHRDEKPNYNLSIH